MKTFAQMIFAGILLAGMTFAQNDFGANARFHMKTGRDLPAVEQAKNAPCCPMPKCTKQQCDSAACCQNKCSQPCCNHAAAANECDMPCCKHHHA
ncbi:MAG TPA: hypothetical protein VFA04_23360 [Bryobacteraceae bacterium]|nr:hypothetical protein [Bryobacteraceae bacterium]